jgi:hypothetical protein
VNLLLYAVGWIIIIFGLFIAIVIHVDFSIVVITVTGGVIILALGKIVEVLERIEKKLPERSYSEEFPAAEFKVKSNHFEVYDSNNETYQYFILDGSEFIQARVFKNYMEINGSSFIYELPNREEIQLTVYKEYSLTAEMFSRDDGLIFVKLSALKINPTRQGNIIFLSYI